jgi:hypothetical protein
MPDASARPTPSDHAGARPGTLTHMAPELLCVRTGAAADAAAADAYAFGVAIWELWTGCRAYEGAPRALRLSAVGGAGLLAAGRLRGNLVGNALDAPDQAPPPTHLRQPPIHPVLAQA